MSENKFCSSAGKDMVCVDTYRILDSCRDKDCFEDVRVYLTERGQEIIDHTGAIRIKGANVIWSGIDINPMPFNRGFYQLNIRIYVKITAEACLAPGNVEEIAGIAAVEKKVVLFGSEGNVNVFRSNGAAGGVCSPHSGMSFSPSTSLPIAVLETVDPLVLNSKIAEPRCRCCCCCSIDEVPEPICISLGGRLCDADNCNRLLVSLGFFSVVRLERPAQYLVHAVEYCVPEKECVAAEDDDPCSVFRRMKFPVSEFCPPSLAESADKCGCEQDFSPKKCCN